MRGLCVDTKELLTILIPIVVSLLAGDGIIQLCIKRWDRKHDKIPQLVKKLNQNGAGTYVSLQAIKVILKALREGHINGESERMEREIDEYFAKCTSNGFFIENEK